MGQTVKFGRVPFKIGFSHSESGPRSASLCFGNGALDQGKDDQGNNEENSMQNVNREIKQTMDGIRMTMGGVTEFLKSKLVNMVHRGCGRKREDIRLQTAQMHAALSVARLATAIAQMVGNCHSESTNVNNIIMTDIGKVEHKKMHAAIASAAALVAASCGEAAKLTGASREQISTVIHMGMETRALGDLLMLTTSAATCLKGANALKIRNRTISNYALEDLMSTQKNVRLPIRTPDDIIFDEHGGTTDFSYPTDEHSYHEINLATSGGNIQLLFEEHEKYNTWKSFIRYLIISKRSRLSY
uniref:VAN3-binding protein-like auxin canalisation domain-containing protein n=1 Tax=Leersia perrieri TaxID=77586 RepID=A0A0D9VJP2_9ORYZ